MKIKNRRGTEYKADAYGLNEDGAKIVEITNEKTGSYQTIARVTFMYMLEHNIYEIIDKKEKVK